MPDPAPPPRSVPLLLRLHVLFGGPLGIVSWSTLAFGLFFTWTFGTNSDIVGAIKLANGGEHVMGRLVAVTGTNFYIGGDEDTQGERVYAYDYEFEAQDRTWGGQSFEVGRNASAGAEVPIEYHPEDPGFSRIAGMRSKPFSAWVALIGLLPLACLPFIGWGLRRGLRASRLLALGKVADARLVDKKETNVTVNDRPVYAYVFQFEDDSGRLHRVQTRTSMPWRLEDEPHECVIYDPFRPAAALLVDSLPGHPDVDARGHFVEGAPGKAILSLLPPAAVVAVVAGLMALG